MVIENHSSVIYLFTHSLNFSFSFRNENPGFKRIVEKLERSPVCQRLPLRSFLVLPFQRITRIKLLVQVCVSVYVCEYVGPLSNSKRWTTCLILYLTFNTHTLFLSRTLWREQLLVLQRRHRPSNLWNFWRRYINIPSSLYINAG